jgi:hypothetical protein
MMLTPYRRRRVPRRKPVAKPMSVSISVVSPEDTAKNKKKADSTKFKYALRTPMGTYWDGRVRPSNGYASMSSTWNVKFLTSPRYWNSKALAANAWKKYELARMCGSEVPDLTMVEFEFSPVETDAYTLTLAHVGVTFAEIMQTRTKYYCDSAAKALIDRVTNKFDEAKAKEYRYMIKRKAKTKQIIDEKFPDTSVSHLNYSLFNRENDVVMARLILGSDMIGYFDLEEFYDHTKPITGFAQNQMS